MIRPWTGHLARPLLALVLLSFLSQAWADDRLGNYTTSTPIYKQDHGNAIQTSVGHLALTTGADYLMLVNFDCWNCPDWAGFFANFTGAEKVNRTIEFPPGKLRAQCSSVTTSRAIFDGLSDKTPVLMINEMEMGDGKKLEQWPVLGTLPQTQGFFGLGVSSTDKERSPLHAASGGRFTLGLNMYDPHGRYNDFPGQEIGRLDWGGVNKDQVKGDFEWLKTDTRWTFKVDRIDTQGGSIDGKPLHVAVDPGLQAIYAPFSVAKEIYAKEKSAVAVRNEELKRTRWKIPCGAKLKFDLKLSDGRTFGIPSKLLIVPEVGDLCYGAVYAWANGSDPDKEGSIRLGTPFLDEWYTALHYANDATQVGFAKHNTAHRTAESGPNPKLVGGLLGAFIPLTLIYLLVVYARNSARLPRWLNRRYANMYDWRHPDAVQAAMAAGQPPPSGPPMPLGVRVLNGLIGPPRGPGAGPPYIDPFPQGVGTPMPMPMPMPMQPMMTGAPPPMPPHMVPPMPPPMQPGMTGMPPPMPPLQPGMTGMHPPMPPPMQPMQPGMTGMPPIPPAMTGMPPPMHPMMTGAPPPMQPGFGPAPHFTGATPMHPMPPFPPPAHHPAEMGHHGPGWSGGYDPAHEQARQEIAEIMGKR